MSRQLLAPHSSVSYGALAADRKQLHLLARDSPFQIEFHKSLLCHLIILATCVLVAAFFSVHPLVSAIPLMLVLSYLLLILYWAEIPLKWILKWDPDTNRSVLNYLMPCTRTEYSAHASDLPSFNLILRHDDHMIKLMIFSLAALSAMLPASAALIATPALHLDSPIFPIFCFSLFSWTLLASMLCLGSPYLPSSTASAFVNQQLNTLDPQSKKLRRHVLQLVQDGMDSHQKHHIYKNVGSFLEGIVVPVSFSIGFFALIVVRMYVWDFPGDSTLWSPFFFLCLLLGLGILLTTLTAASVLIFGDYWRVAEEVLLRQKACLLLLDPHKLAPSIELKEQASMDLILNAFGLERASPTFTLTWKNPFQACTDLSSDSAAWLQRLRVWHETRDFLRLYDGVYNLSCISPVVAVVLIVVASAIAWTVVRVVASVAIFKTAWTLSDLLRLDFVYVVYLAIWGFVSLVGMLAKMAEICQIAEHQITELMHWKLAASCAKDPELRQYVEAMIDNLPKVDASPQMLGFNVQSTTLNIVLGYGASAVVTVVGSVLANWARNG